MEPLQVRTATWNEVALQFAGHGGAAQAAKNCRIWSGRYGVEPEDYHRLQVTLEAWSHTRLAECLAAMAKIEPRMLTEDLPRVHGLPISVIRFGDRIGMIDGKHRANHSAKFPGLYAVLVIESAHR